jgi:imidazolonepropionase-like amidohydrolase
MIRKIILTSLCLVVLPVFYCIIKFLNAKECLIVYSDHIYNYETMSYDHLKYIISYYGDTELKTDHITDDQKKQCEFLDLKNKYIHSGLTDAHTHLLTTDFSKSKSWMQTIEYSSSLSDIQRINLGLKNAKSMLLYGFTTVRDVGNSGNFLDVQLRNHIRKNHLRAPNLIVTGPGITYLEPQFNIKNENGEYIVINMSTQIENIFKTYIDNNITWIKVYSDNSIKNNIMPKELLNKLVETAHKLNLKVVLHTEFFDSFRNSITTGADTIEHFYEFDSTDASSRKPVLTITPLSFEDCEALNKNSFSLASNCILAEELKTKQINLANGNGFDIIFGSDFVNDNITAHLNRGEATTATLISLSKNNLSPQQIFKIAVLNPNKIFNSNNFQTNLVAYDEDPMADIKNIHKPYLVIKEGLIVPSDD